MMRWTMMGVAVLLAGCGQQLTSASPKASSASVQAPARLKAQDLTSSGVVLSLSRAAQGETVTATFLPAANPLSSLSAADAWCATSFGAGWRMAEFHDGGAAGEGLSGWDFWAETNSLSSPSRFRVAISDQAANPWNSTIGKGMTWQVLNRFDQLPHSYLRLGRSEQTDPYQGDAENSLSLPIACLKATGQERPSVLPPRNDLRGGWSGAEVRFTAPVSSATLAGPGPVDAASVPSVQVGGYPAANVSLSGNTVTFAVPSNIPTLSGTVPVTVQAGSAVGTASLEVMNLPPANPNDPDASGGLLVTLKEGVQETQALHGQLLALGFTFVSDSIIPLSGSGACGRPLLRLVDIRAGRTVSQAIEDLKNLKTVYEVDPNGSGVVHSSKTGVSGRKLPDDPSFPSDPPLDPQLPSPQTLKYLDQMGVPAAWASGFNGNGITIAVLDTGIVKHSAFTDRVLPFTDRLLPGVNFVGTISKAGNDYYRDDYGQMGHGTPVASLALAIAPGARILPIKVCDSSGKCPSEDVIRGVCYALANADNRNLILNLSFGGKVDSHALSEVLKQAVDNGVLISTAGGNDGQSGNPQHYPAADSKDGILAVAALKEYQVICDAWGDPGACPPGSSGFFWNAADFSTRGDYLDIASPGVALSAATTECGNVECKGGVMNGFSDKFEGTSFASPIVAGALALARQKYPYPQYSSAYIEDILKIKVKKLDAGANEVGAGMIDLHFLSQ